MNMWKFKLTNYNELVKLKNQYWEYSIFTVRNKLIKVGRLYLPHYELAVLQILLHFWLSIAKNKFQKLTMIWDRHTVYSTFRCSSTLHLDRSNTICNTVRNLSFVVEGSFAFKRFLTNVCYRHRKLHSTCKDADP